MFIIVFTGPYLMLYNKFMGVSRTEAIPKEMRVFCWLTNTAWYFIMESKKYRENDI